MAELAFKGPVYWENRKRYFSTIGGAFLAVQDQVLGGEIRREDVRVYACRVREGQLVAEEVLAHVWVLDFEHPVVFPESWWVASALNKNTLGGPRLCPGCRGVDGEHDFGATCTLRDEGEDDE